MLNYIERIEKAESLVFNKTKKGLLNDNAKQFKTLISGLGLSIEFFLMSYLKNNSINKTRKSRLKTKIKNFIEIANIKTKLGFYYGNSIKKNKVFTMLF